MWKHVYLAKCKHNVHTQSDNNVAYSSKGGIMKNKSDSLFEHDQKRNAGNVGRAT